MSPVSWWKRADRPRCAALFGAVAALLASGAPRAEDPPPPDGSGPETIATEVASLRRIVRRFDFEEPERILVEFPTFFKRNIAEDRGFPPFGSMRLTDRESYEGRWSFEFSLDGGSLSAEIPTGIIPVLPTADYTVSVLARTVGIEHARARLVAALHDANGAIIPGSRVESEAVSTRGAWVPLRVSVPGNFLDATDLVVELQLVQPRHLLGDEAAPDEPMFEDVSGRAWFDDLVVWHTPRIALETQSNDNIIVQPATPRLSILVRDVTNEPLTAHLRVVNVDLESVFERTFPAPRGRHPLEIELPITTCGWYRAELDVRSPERLAGRHRISFVVLPPDARSGVADPRIAVVLPPTPSARLGRVPALLQRLGAGSCSIPIWERHDTKESLGERIPMVRELVEALLERGIDLTFCLNEVPQTLAGSLGVDPTQVIEVIGRDPASWREYIDEMLVNFGLRVRRWQLGDAHRPDAFWRSDLDTLVLGASDSLAQFVPSPSVIVPFSAEQELPTPSATPSVHVRVPHEVRPEALAEYAAPWSGDREVIVSLDVLPAESFPPKERTLDLMMRMLHAWRAGLPWIAIDAPWQWSEEIGGPVTPDPAFAAWRGLAEALRSRTFVGELDLAPGVQCWLLRGERPVEDALVTWTEGTNERPVPVRLVLENESVHLLDGFGNRRRLDVEQGTHRFQIEEMPIVVEGINLPLALFRSRMAIEPAYLPAIHRAHEAVLVLRNPWLVSISGSIELDPSPNCEIAPRRMEFAINPGDEVRLPISIVLDRSVVAGPRRIGMDVRLNANRRYRIHDACDLEIGWKELEVDAQWKMARNVQTGAHELVITQRITNHGEEAVNLEAFLIGPGLGQSRRMIGLLHPGTSAVKSFHVPNGAALLSGRTVRLGITEQDGLAVLNRLLTLPDFSGLVPPPQTAGAESDESNR